jgi:hypothetical protein
VKFLLHSIAHVFHFGAEMLGLTEEHFDPRSGRKLRQATPSGASCYPYYRRLDDEQLVTLDEVR